MPTEPTRDENGDLYRNLGAGLEALRDSGLLYLLNECVLHGRGYEARVAPNGELWLFGDGRALRQWPDGLLDAVDGRRRAARQTLLDAEQYNNPGHYEGHSKGFPAPGVMPHAGQQVTE